MAVTKYFYDGDTVFQEYDGAGNTLAEYTSTGQGYGDLLSTYDGSAAKYYEPDALGSTDALADQSQTVVDRWRYRAFGAATQTVGTDSTPFTWVGRLGYYADTETGLYQLGNGTRYYDPQTVQFLSEDPIGFAGGVSNLRGYVENLPTRYVDPTGRWPCDLCLPSFSPRILPKKLCTPAFEADVAKAFELFKKCDEAVKLMKKCERRNFSKISVVCDVNAVSDADWDYVRKRISINPNIFGVDDRSIESMAALILFEMLNACASIRWEEAEEACRAGRLSEVDFVEKVERIEYDNIGEYIRIFNACIKQGAWPVRENPLGGFAGVSFRDYLNTQIEGGHTAPYKKFWKDNCERAFWFGAFGR